MKTFFLLCTALFLFNPVLSAHGLHIPGAPAQQDTTVANEAQFRASLAFINEHRESIIRNIHSTFDFDFQNNPTLKPIYPAFLDLMMKEISWDDVSIRLAFFYMEHFSLEQLKELDDFFKTETGKKFMAHFPPLLGLYQEIGMKFMYENQDKIEDMVIIFKDGGR